MQKESGSARDRSNHKRRGRLLALGLAVAAAVSGAAFAPTAAQAATSECLAGNFCAWNHGDFNYYMTGWGGDKTAWDTVYRNYATSLYNHGNNCQIRFYDETNQGGYYGDLARSQTYAQLASWWIVWPGVNFDNRIEGHVWRC